MRRVLDSFLADNEFLRNHTPSTQLSEESNPLVEEIARRRLSSENSDNHIIEEPPLSSTMSNDSIPCESASTESPSLHLPPPTQAQSEALAGHPRRRLMLVHTIFISGPHGGIVIRTGHLLPDNVQPGSEMIPETTPGEQEAQTHVHDPMHDHNHEEHEHHHHHGLLDFLRRLNPLNLFRSNRPEMERTQSEEQESQPTENDPLGLHHAHSEPDRPDESIHHIPGPGGVRIFLNPMDLFSNGFTGLDQLLQEIFRGMSEHEGAPPATEEALSNLKEFDYVSGKESEMCAICHDDFGESQRISQLPCEHMYHKDCVTKWLKMHDICPMCRSPIQKEGQTIPQP